MLAGNSNDHRHLGDRIASLRTVFSYVPMQSADVYLLLCPCVSPPSRQSVLLVCHDSTDGTCALNAGLDGFRAVQWLLSPSVHISMRAQKADSLTQAMIIFYDCGYYFQHCGLLFSVDVIWISLDVSIERKKLLFLNIVYCINLGNPVVQATLFQTKLGPNHGVDRKSFVRCSLWISQIPK